MIEQQLVNGIMLGSTYALIGIGFALILGILDMLNLAVGEIFMFGAFIGLALVRLGVPFILAIAGAMIGGAIVSVILERVSFYPLRNAPPLTPMLSTMAFSIVLQNLAGLLWGTEQTRFPTSIPRLDFYIGSVLVSATHITIVGSAAVLMIGLDLLVQRTRIGRGMRAVAENTETASILGVNSQKIIWTTFLLSGAIAGAAGVLVGLAFSQISPYIGVDTGLKGIAAMIVGGLGSLRGAMLGGLFIGILEVMSIQVLNASYRDVVVYGLLILVLIVRPQGFLGTAQVARV